MVTSGTKWHREYKDGGAFPAPRTRCEYARSRVWESRTTPREVGGLVPGVLQPAFRLVNIRGSPSLRAGPGPFAAKNSQKSPGKSAGAGRAQCSYRRKAGGRGARGAWVRPAALGGWQAGPGGRRNRRGQAGTGVGRRTGRGTTAGRRATMRTRRGALIAVPPVTRVGHPLTRHIRCLRSFNRCGLGGDDLRLGVQRGGLARNADGTASATPPPQPVAGVVSSGI